MGITKMGITISCFGYLRDAEDATSGPLARWVEFWTYTLLIFAQLPRLLSSLFLGSGIFTCNTIHFGVFVSKSLGLVRCRSSPSFLSAQHPPMHTWQYYRYITSCGIAFGEFSFRVPAPRTWGISKVVKVCLLERVPVWVIQKGIQQKERRYHSVVHNTPWSPRSWQKEYSCANSKIVSHPCYFRL